ncbi:RNA polymerase sigma factor, partial [Pseudonocardia lacus]|uniref:RNA polymerase sigma factor n=1 Tax=Pseudonocardia lacus TaxID=2835865 RepID=UPI001BDD5EC9
QDAYATAVATWPRDGVPDRPDAWLLAVARRRAVDRFRREATLARKLRLLVGPDVVPGPEEGGGGDVDAVPDERLRLLFTCCHPALSVEAGVALTLRLLGGLSTAEIARAFLVPEPTMAARITRAKHKIAVAGIPYRVPTGAELPDRLHAVLRVIYLIFTEGHSASAGAVPVRADLCAEAVRLAGVAAALLPDEPEALGLRALLLLQHARRDARVDGDGRLVLLGDQDRSRWDAEAVATGLEVARAAASRVALRAAGPFLLQAAIAAEHAAAATAADTAADTDWARIALLYTVLEERTGSPVVRLNRAVAVAETDGPAAALALLDGLDDRLAGYHLLPATRADLLRRLGRAADARTAYARAVELAGNDADRAFLADRLAALDLDPSGAGSVARRRDRVGPAHGHRDDEPGDG